MTWIVEVHDVDLFAVRWRFLNPAAIEWELHRIVGFKDNLSIYADERHDDPMKAFDVPKFAPIGGGHILYGDLKFDGCLNVQQSQANCMMHFCESRSGEPLLSKMICAVFVLGPRMRGWT